MKKWLSLLLCVFLLAGLVACGTSEDGTDTTSATPVSDTSTASVTNTATDTGSAATSEEPKVFASAEEVLAASDHWLGVTDQRHDRLAIYDLANPDWTDPAAVMWEVSDSAHIHYPAGIKFRHFDEFGGDLLLYCGKVHAGVYRMDTKELIYYTNQTPTNPHTVELLPNGTFLVGGTQGVALFAYDLRSGKPNLTAKLLPGYDVHGVLWDPEYEVLWVAGAHNLQAYAVSGTPAAPKFTLMPSMATDKLPSGVHDLAPVYGDVEKLWVTTSGGVVQVNKDDMSISKAYGGSKLTGNNKYTPGVGNFPDGTLFWICPNENMEEWTSDELFGYVPYGNEKFKKITYKQPADAWYKCRVFCTDYQ